MRIISWLAAGAALLLFEASATPFVDQEQLNRRAVLEDLVRRSLGIELGEGETKFGFLNFEKGKQELEQRLKANGGVQSVPDGDGTRVSCSLS